MEITLNGKVMQVAGQITVQTLIQTQGLPEKRIVVECNGEIIQAKNWNRLIIKAHDRLEIVTFVGGG